MAARVIEARLIIGGEDKGASAMVEKVTKAVKQFAKDADMSAAMRKAADEAAKTEKAFNAVTKAMSGREGFAKAQADVKTAEMALAQYTKQLDAARQAKAAFASKPMKGTEEATAYAAATKVLREVTTAHRAAEREVAKTTTAMHAQSTAMREADRAAAHLGADLGNLEAQQRRLRSSFEANTAAMAKQVAMEERAAKVSAARQARMDAWKGAAGIVGLSAVHRAEHFAGHALHTYQHFDNERRFGQVVMDLTDEQQKPLVDQAIHMGAVSRYNDVKVLHAQRELAARGLGRDQILGMIPHVKDLGQALDIDIGDAAKQVEAGIFAFKKDIGTLDAATRSAKQTADVQVKAAKISGMTPEDIQQAYKYGATPARLAHVSEERMLAFAGVLKKATIGGDEAGVAFRALMSMANAPTAGAKVAMRAAGLDYNNYQKKPDKLAVDPFVKQVAESYGVQLDGTVQAGLRRIFSNKAIIGDSTKFTPAVMALLSENLGGDDAKSKKSIAGLANRYRNASMGGVDSNRLIDDLLVKLRDNLAFANALFGSKQGGRIATALSDAETFKKMQHLLQDHSEGYASKVSEARMAGFDGAVKRLDGAVTNLETKLGRAWDNDGKGGVLTDVTNRAGQFVQHLAEMDNAVVRAGTVFAAVGSGFVALKSLGLLQSGFGLKGSAVALDHSALALEAAAVKLAGGSTLNGLPGGGASEKGKPGGKLKGALGFGLNAFGALALEPLAEQAQERHIFEMPDLGKDGWLRSGLNFLDPNAGNVILGDRARAMPSMTLRPGDVPLTLGRSGIDSFGLGGGMSPEDLAKRDADRYARSLADARRSAPPLNPGDELPGLGPDLATKGEEAGKAIVAGIGRGLTAGPLPLPGQPAFEPLKDAAGEAGRQAGGAFGKAIIDAPLPPPRPDTFEPLKNAAGEAGTQAGEKAGRAIAEGVQQQAPVVEQQGLSILQRLQQMFSQGIFVPIHLRPSDGPNGSGFGGAGVSASAGGIVKASYNPDEGSPFRGGNRSGAGGSSSIPGRNAFGGVDPMGAAGADSKGGGGSGTPSPYVAPATAFPGTDISRLPAGMRNNNPGNIKFTRVGAFGTVIGPSRNRDQGDAQAVFPTQEDGMRAASDLIARKYGQGRDTIYNLVAARGGWTPGNAAAAANIARTAGVGVNQRLDLSDPDMRARVLRGLVTQEHGPASRLYSDEMIRRAVRPKAPTKDAFLPNGAPAVLKPNSMPDAPGVTMEEADRQRQIRSVPDAPKDGFGSRGAGDLHGVADSMHAAAARFENASMHAQLDVRLSGQSGARVTGMRTSATGAVDADMGISMPHTRPGSRFA